MIRIIFNLSLSVVSTKMQAGQYLVHVLVAGA